MKQSPRRAVSCSFRIPYCTAALTLINLLNKAVIENIELLKTGFQQSNISNNLLLRYINWIVPVDFILNTLTAWLLAVAGYYCWSVVLRWIKAID